MGVVRATAVARYVGSTADLCPEGRVPPAGGVRFGLAPKLPRDIASTRSGALRAARAPSPEPVKSPTVVRERLVGFRHAMGFFALLDRAAPIFGSIHQFAGQLARHGVLATLARGVDQPA